MGGICFTDVPGELLLEVFSYLDYGSLAAISTVNRQFRHYTQDPVVWRAVHRRTFSKGRETLTGERWRMDFVARIQAAREFLVRGTNDYVAAVARRLFSEMGLRSGMLIHEMLESSHLSISALLVDGQGYAMSNIHRLLPRCGSSEVPRFLHEHHSRLVADPRSEIYLLRMLLARHTGYTMRITNLENYLRCAHLITYNTLDNPIFFFPPSPTNGNPVDHRYELRSRLSRTESPEEIYGTDPVVNWGVVETIHSLVKLYRDHMGEAIPNFVKSRDDYEFEVPMCSSMFDADLVGNWRGLYGYLDFRELEVLDSTRAFTPDFFDGISSLKIHSEEPSSSSTHPLSHHHHHQHHNNVNNDFLAGVYDRYSGARNSGSEALNHSSEDSELFPDGALKATRFVADGTSVHGRFHLHGSTLHLPKMEPGFKITTFDEMYNADGLMPWIMEGINIPSVGIVGRWRDRNESLRDGVEGPYCLWRDRVKDLQDQETSIKEAQRAQGLDRQVDEPTVCPTKYLRRATTDMSYIITEERQSYRSS